MLTDRVRQAAPGQLPLRLRVAQQLGQRHPGPEGVLDARRPREERGPVHRRRAAVVPLLGPGDPTPRELHRDGEVEPAPDHRPEPVYKVEVTAHQPVVPHADREVRGHVGLAAGIHHVALHDLDRHRAVRALHRRYPGQGTFSGSDLTGGQERHRALHVVPHVGVLTGPPRDRPRRLLLGDDRARRRTHVGGSQQPLDAGDVSRHRAPRPRAAGSTGRATCRPAGRAPGPPSAVPGAAS